MKYDSSFLIELNFNLLSVIRCFKNLNCGDRFYRNFFGRNVCTALANEVTSCTLSKTKCDNGQTTEICGCLEREKINQINSFSENVLLAYIGKLSKDSKSSNVRRMYIVDISQYAKVKTFKRFKSKKGKYHHNNFKHLFTMYLTINSYLRRQ